MSVRRRTGGGRIDGFDSVSVIVCFVALMIVATEMRRRKSKTIEGAVGIAGLIQCFAPIL